MEYGFENDRLAVRATTCGAELTSILDKQTGKQWLWQADDAVWGRRAPLLFPYCGSLYNDEMRVEGKRYPAPRHGFARDAGFVCTRHDDKALVFQLEDSVETRASYPFPFFLEVRYTLEGNTLLQRVRVKNPLPPTMSAEKHNLLPFSVGFHPAFALPFAPGKATGAHEFVFDVPETPSVVETPDGYVSGARHPLFEGEQTLTLREDLFDDDSICLTGLRSETITLREKSDPDNRVTVSLEGFPYVLLWATPTRPLRFACIEPWHGLPDGPEPYGDFVEKPGLTLLAPGEKFTTTLKMAFGS